MRPLPTTRRALLRAIDAPRVQRAIAAAERRTSGEIRVSVSPFFWGDVRHVAERAFERLGMTATRDHGGGVDAARARWGGAREDWIDLWGCTSAFMRRHLASTTGRSR